MKKLSGKSLSEYIHASKRAKERYDLELTPELENRFVNKIKKGRGEFVKRYSTNRTEWRLLHEGFYYRVIYDKLRKRIVTFLPIQGVVSIDILTKEVYESLSR
jgi:hypothetical protein